MTLSQAEIELIDTALVSLGENPLEAIEDTQPIVAQAGRLYARARDFCLGRTEWKFLLEFVQLNRVTGEFPGSYPYRFHSPVKGIVRAVYDDVADRRPYKNFRIMGDALVSDCETLWADVQVPGADPVRWSASFRELVIKATEASFAFSITADRVHAANLSADAYGAGLDYPEGGLMGAALAEDAQSDPGAVLDFGETPLTAVRY